MTSSSFRKAICPAVATLTLLLAPLAFAQEPYTGEFELEGDILDKATTTPPDTSGIGTDWSAVFQVAPGSTAVPTNANPLPENVKTASFLRDFVIGKTSDSSTFTTGSKDVQNISGGGQVKGNWQCTDSNNVSDKGDILDAYAAIQIDQDVDDSDVKLLFGIERYSEHGSAKIGLWFLQDDSVSCPGSGTRNFMGNHVDGDLLIVADFDKGGNLTVIQAFEWRGGAGGYLDPAPIATGQDCKTTGDPDLFCATTNSVALSWKPDGKGTVPWYIETKTTVGAGTSVENVLPATTFVEGVLNLTHYKAQRCFTTFLANTRQSTSLTSTIFDYTMGSFNACTVGVAKACTAKPTITDGGKWFTYPYVVTLTNTGAGSIYSLQVQEGAYADTAGESCKLNGQEMYGSTTNADDNPWLSIGSAGTELAAGASTTVAITCRDHVNGFANSIRVRARSASGGTLWDVGSSYTMSSVEADTCKADITGNLAVTKECAPDAVSLVSTGGGLGIQVKVVVGITNGYNEALDQVTLVDDKVPAGNFQQVCDIKGTPLSNCASYTPFNGSLAPGDSVFFGGTYNPTSVSSGTMSCPNSVVFTDTAHATARGYLSGQSVTSNYDSANCGLCVVCTAP